MSLTARVEPGLFGPELERLLGEQGMTLGHFPQSFEYSTVGGWVATRSAGQASTGYGRIDELVEAVRCETPAGRARHPATCPPPPPGPSLRELVVGSEGVLGVITEATAARAPAAARRATTRPGRSAPSRRAPRPTGRWSRPGASPDVARLSDEGETRLSMALASSGSLAERAGRAYLRPARPRASGCLAFTGFEGTPDDVARRRGRAAGVLRAHGAVALGQKPGRSWLKSRFAAPYLRDELLDRGVMVETLETATTWSNLHRLYDAVGAALRESLTARGTPRR